MDDGSPGDVKTFIDGLGAENAGGADLICPFARLVEHECEDVLIVGDGDTVRVNYVVKDAVVGRNQSTHMLWSTSSRCRTTAARPVR